MNKLTFIALCNKYTIDAGFALENESIINTLQNKNLTLEEKFIQLEFILSNEF